MSRQKKLRCGDGIGDDQALKVELLDPWQRSLGPTSHPFLLRLGRGGPSTGEERLDALRRSYKLGLMRARIHLLFYLFVSFVFPRVLRAEEFDVLVYGATPSGIAAAVAAGRDGARVMLVESSGRVGGMLTHGLSHSDFRTFESLNGSFLEFARRVEGYYRKEYGADSLQVSESLRGTNGEPKVNLATFEAMLAELPNVQVRRNWQLEAVRFSFGGSGESGQSAMRTVDVALFWDAAGMGHPIAAHYFIDATYEGDLLAAVGMPYKIGREGRADHGELLAPLKADDELQGYNFRLCMTQKADNRVMARRPEGYRREVFEGIVPLLESGKIPALFAAGAPALFMATLPHLPNGKFDINDVPRAPVRLSIPGGNLAWPDGDAGVAIQNGKERDFLRPPFSRLALNTARERIVASHRFWVVGLLYFLQNDPAVPQKFKDEARSWGFARDEFQDSHHVPEMLYVREARRLVGTTLFTQRDTERVDGEARACLHTDAVAIGDYGPNCHGTSHQGDLFEGKHSGEFYQPSAPYQIPYGVLVPRLADNLLVSCAVSSTHVGFCSLRYEPVWMSLGEAAGHAAVLANKVNGSVQKVSVAALQQILHKHCAATIYVSDIAPDSPDFAAVQWWGTAGGFHGLEAAAAKGVQRGKQIAGQYFEAFPAHAVQLDMPLEEALRERWQGLANSLGVEKKVIPPAEGNVTRGDWLRAVWKLRAP